MGIDPSAAELVGAGVLKRFDVSTETDDAGEFGTADFPRIAVAEPVVGFFHLAVIDDELFENAEIVTDPVSVGGQFESRHGVEEAGGETSESAVAESRVDFLFPQFFDFKSELRHRFFCRIVDAEVDHGVADGSADQEFEGDVADGFGFFLFINVLGGEPFFHHEVADGERQSLIAVQITCFFGAFRQRACQMAFK